MGKIRLLDESTIEKIAAGEVIERPSSVVKELTENSIDAGATIISIQIKDGGTTFIRITDNGCGIGGDELRLAFTRHATSKISNSDDIINVKSLGFRGEALASIAAVAKVELITKTSEEVLGQRYVIEASEEKALEDIGAPTGTTIIVKDLFFNTPVRRKFLKSDITESSYIESIVESLALSHPEISFNLTVNGKQKLYTSGNGKLKDAIFNVFGKEITSNIIEVDGEREHVKVYGFIGKPTITRGNRSKEICFINKRVLKNALMYSAIEEAYKGYLMQHMYPFAVLFIELFNPLLDVNVHPAKTDIRIYEGNLLKREITEIIRYAIEQRELIQEQSLDYIIRPNETRLSDIERKPEPFEINRIEAIRASVSKDIPYEKKYEYKNSERMNSSFDSPFETKSSDAPTLNREPEKDDFIPKSHIEESINIPSVEEEFIKKSEAISNEQLSFFDNIKQNNAKLIGQLFDTYWLAEADDKLYIVDQHAAHEKILYERNVKRFSESRGLSQQVSPPLIISLNALEQSKLEESKDLLLQTGYEIEPFGGNEFAINAIPDNLFGADPKRTLFEILDSSAQLNKPCDLSLICEKIASASCKAAIKGNHKMTIDEAKALFEELMTLENPYNCPHGRPTLISMTKYEVEKRFKRIL